MLRKRYAMTLLSPLRVCLLVPLAQRGHQQGHVTTVHSVATKGVQPRHVTCEDGKMGRFFPMFVASSVDFNPSKSNLETLFHARSQIKMVGNPSPAAAFCPNLSV